jgi:hypothetical protein
MNYSKPILALSLIVLLAGGCIVNPLRVGPTVIDTHTIEQGAAGTVSAEITMGVGELTLRGGGSELLNAEFTYNVDAWKPEVRYSVNGRRGELRVQQPENKRLDNVLPTANDVRYQWDLQLGADVPLDLKVVLGVGESRLALGNLALTNLEIITGVGQTAIDFSGKWRESFNASIKGGVGETTVRLPGDVGVRVRTTTGIGAVNVNGLQGNGNIYTNAAYGTADVNIDLTVEGGIGQITLVASE